MITTKTVIDILVRTRCASSLGWMPDAPRGLYPPISRVKGSTSTGEWDGRPDPPPGASDSRVGRRRAVAAVGLLAAAQRRWSEGAPIAQRVHNAGEGPKCIGRVCSVAGDPGHRHTESGVSPPPDSGVACEGLPARQGVGALPISTARGLTGVAASSLRSPRS
jgi:hypothetical protein